MMRNHEILEILEKFRRALRAGLPVAADAAVASGQCVCGAEGQKGHQGQKGQKAAGAAVASGQ